MVFVGVKGLDSRVIEPELLNQTVTTMTQGLLEKLKDVVPAYMVPLGFIPIAGIPITTNGKTDRKSLKQHGSSLSLDEMASLTGQLSGDKAIILPSTEAEKAVLHLWASVLSVEPSSISVNDNFLRIGGDSIQAMRLVAAARNNGYHITVADVFKTPKLHDLALLLEANDSDAGDIESVTPFSLIPKSLDSIQFRKAIKQQTLSDLRSTIVDVYPVTDVQHNYIDAGLVNAGACVMLYLDFSSSIGINSLTMACERLWQEFDILRTAFVSYDNQYWHVIPTSDTPAPISAVQSVGNFTQFCNDLFTKSLSENFELGTPYTKFVVIQSHDTIRLAIRLNHAQYDGVSFIPLLESLSAKLNDDNDSSLVLPQYSAYIRQVQQQETSSLTYWRNFLAASQPLKLSPIRSSVGSVQSTSSDRNNTVVLKHSFDAPKTRTETTAASHFIAACAFAISKTTHASDIVFGLTVSGRANLSSPLDKVIGPCLNVIPIRVKINEGTSFNHVLSQIQEQRAAGIGHETATCSSILKSCTDWPEHLRRFSCMVQFQDIDENPEFETNSTQHGRSQLNMFTAGELNAQLNESTDLFIFAKPVAGQWTIDFAGRENVIGRSECEALLGMVEDAANLS